MKKNASIIPFPRQTGVENQNGKPIGSTKYSCTVVPYDSEAISKIDVSQQELQNLIGLMIERCANLVDAMDGLVDYLEIGSMESEKTLRATWDRSNAIRGRYLKVFEHVSTVASFDEIHRTAVALDLSVAYARSAADFILKCRLQTDPFMLELAIQNDNCAQTLYSGFRKLASDPILAAREVREAPNRLQRIEKTYHQAITQLAGGGAAGQCRVVSQDSSVSFLSGIFEMYERRRIYKSLFKSAKRLSWTANRLHNPYLPQSI